jgi:hypothetical protein
MRATLPVCCALAASGTARKLRVSVMMHPMALYLMGISSNRPQTNRFPLQPNATRRALEIAGAKHERRLFPVACTRLFGTVPYPDTQNVGAISSDPVCLGLLPPESLSPLPAASPPT